MPDWVLQLLLDVATDHTLSVSALASSHPINIFATDRVSGHTIGRAVDIWALDGVPIISQRDHGGPLHTLVADLLDQGVVRQLGAPWVIAGPDGRRSFTDTVHQDHLHLGLKDP